MKIVHMSDWHNEWSNLPCADVYVCTGDMLDNYPIIRNNSMGIFGYSGPNFDRIIDHKLEKQNQEKWFKRNFIDKRKIGLRHFLPKSCKDNPVVVVRGNHDFTNLGPMFGGEVFEISRDSSRSVEYCGLKFGGFRGVPSFSREWSDEFEDHYFEEKISMLPTDLDVVVTHAPPWGFLDKHGNENLGIKALGSWINNKQYDGTKMPKLFCFGHIHSGLGTIELDDGTIFSNAATSRHTINLGEL